MIKKEAGATWVLRSFGFQFHQIFLDCADAIERSVLSIAQIGRGTAETSFSGRELAGFGV